MMASTEIAEMKPMAAPLAALMPLAMALDIRPVLFSILPTELSITPVAVRISDRRRAISPRISTMTGGKSDIGAGLHDPA